MLKQLGWFAVLGFKCRFLGGTELKNKYIYIVLDE